jgi:hypothetical protein
MIILAMMAILTGFANIWIAKLKPTLEARVTDLLMVVVIDTLLLVGYKIWIGDPMFSIFLSIKYLFFCIVDFDKTLRRGIK